MAYTSNKAPDELTALTTLATGDLLIVGDVSDTAEEVKAITVSNAVTDLVSNHSLVDTSSAQVLLNKSASLLGIRPLNYPTNTGNLQLGGSSQNGNYTIGLPNPSNGDETGLGATDANLVYRETAQTLTNKTLSSPTLVTPALGTPASGVLTNCTGYTGDSSLVTVGTISSGTWQGTAVADSYVASASTWNAKIANLSEDTTPQLGGDLDANGKFIGDATEYDNGNSSTADTIDWDNGNFQKSTLTGNCTYTFNAPTLKGRCQLRVIQDATGSRTVTWPASVKWPSGTAPTLSTGASAIDIITFFYDGTNYYGVDSLNFS